MTPSLVPVDVSSNDTAFISFELQKVLALPEVKVTPPTVRHRFAAEFDERRKNGLGPYRDSTEIGRHAALSVVFGGMTGVRVVSKGGRVQAIKLGTANGPLSSGDATR